MENYKIRYEILNYTKLLNRINEIINNQNNKFKVQKHDPIGYTTCNFPINHYSIGNGLIHVLYFGGCHGNEIISVDFVTQLMENLALGNGVFASFDENIYTIDFIPCLNPEGFCTTTYGLQPFVKDLTKDKLERFCQKYYESYKNEDVKITKFNEFLKEVLQLNGIDNDEYLKIFWKSFKNYSKITRDDLKRFLIGNNLFVKDIDSLLNKYFFDEAEISMERLHQEMFSTIDIDCVPSLDDSHIALKSRLEELYKTNNFPISTLANFYANARGVNLNDNNPYYYEELKERIQNEGLIYANLRENNLIKSIPGPIGSPNYDMSMAFVYEKENQCLLDFLDYQTNKGINYCSINCHSTGGLLYFNPYYTNDLESPNPEEKKLSFLINNILASEYVKTTGEVYKRLIQSNEDATKLAYKLMGYPSRITGVGDILRKTYNAGFLLELSKMGGNPLGPYGDREGNFNITMIINMEACMQLLKTIKKIDYLYGISYIATDNKLANAFSKIRKK